MSGTTLVELMVATALFGVLSLGMFGMLATYLVRVRSAERQIDFSEAIQEFQEYLDADLGNATQLIQCGCGSNTESCRYSEAATSLCKSSPTDPGSITVCSEVLLYYESETSLYPIAAASPMPGTCLQPTRSNPMPISLGCKQRRILRYKAPSTAMDRPGELQILADNRSTIGAAFSGSLDSLTILARLPGVYQVSCGLIQGTENSGSPAPHLFRLDARAKSRTSLSPKGAADWEGWSEGETGFNNGVHRQISSLSEFRNLSFPGVHFGRVQTSRTCTADGVVDPTGTGNCCSGYMDAAGTCVPMSQCAPSGTSKAESNFFECCSHKVYEGECA